MNIFSALETLNDENNIDEKWDNIKDCITSAATELQDIWKVYWRNI